MASRAGLSLVVTNDEPTAITDAYAFMKLGYQSNPNSDFRVVVNMAASRFEGERTFNTLRKACESFLQKSPKLAGVIRRDERVREAIRRQVPLLTRYPNTAAAEDIVLSSKIPIRPFTSKEKALEVLKKFFKGKQENAGIESVLEPHNI